ncbi:MAG TPA: dihydrodipicolinate synthase family protein [Gemmatimonadaceae bacterium]|nr:dihydrodipicolinate synthase family protein [Gemmatimonadaceae bacterium]
MRPALGGVLAPVTTPFDASGEVATHALTANLRAHLSDGVDGIVIAGSTGEAALLEEAERRVLLHHARDVVPTDRLLVMGTGAESTRSCMSRCRMAAEEGADYVLVVAPHYYGGSMTAEALRAHYRAVADASPVPVILYNIPKYAHFALPAELVAELAAHENVAGIKDSSGDLALLEAYLRAQGDRFTVLTGSGTTLLDALRRGARGGILAVALFATSLVRELLAAQRAGSAEAAALQERLLPLAAEIVGALGVPGVKAAMDARGLAGGAPRAPLLPLGAAGHQRVRALLTAALPADAAPVI